MKETRDPREGEDDVLRSAYASITPPPGECPASEVLAALATGEVSEPERSRLADHVVVCSRCAADWRILSATHREAFPRGGRARWVGLAAAAAALAVIGVLVTRPAARHSESEPEGEAFRGRRVATEDALTPKAGSRLDSPPREFAWRPPAGSSSRRIRLFDASGRRVWESDSLPEPRAALPESVAAALPDGPYFWTVEVETAGGTEKLGPFPFDLARR